MNLRSTVKRNKGYPLYISLRHSYTGNPLGCAVALANLQIFKQERTLARLQPKIAALTALLKPLAWFPHVEDIRQMGSVAEATGVVNCRTSRFDQRMEKASPRAMDWPFHILTYSEQRRFY